MAEAGWGGESTIGVQRRRFRTGLSRDFCGDISAILTVVTVSVASLLASMLLGEYSEPVKYISIGLFGGIATAELFSQGGYHEFDRLLSVWRSLRGLVWRWTLVLLAMTALAFVTGVTDQFSRRWFVYWGTYGALGIIITRFVTSHLLLKMTRDGALTRRIAIVGATEIAAKFYSLMESSDSGVEIAGVYDDRAPHRELSEEILLSGTIDDLMRLGMRGDIDDIVIALPWSAGARIDEVFHRLAVLPVNTVVCPDMVWLMNMHGGVSYLGGVPLLSIHKRPLEGWGTVIKAVEDRLISGLMLLGLAPLMAMVALLVKLDSPGPVFFGQRRHGFQHDVFTIYKFRTMTVMENGDRVTQAQKNDPRVTRIGAFLRRYSLDELPQLWNVLKGDMSLVGPRPHAVAHNEQYAQIIADYAGRHKVRPGITGWAQVNGCRGETSEDSMMEDRVRLDLAYIENWTVLFDIRILVMTVWAVIFPKNAY